MLIDVSGLEMQMINDLARRASVRQICLGLHVPSVHNKRVICCSSPRSKIEPPNVPQLAQMAHLNVTEEEVQNLHAIKNVALKAAGC